MSSDLKRPQRLPVEWPALEFATKLLEASLVLSAFLYVVGWSYIYGYFRAFGIPLQLVGFGVQDTLVHSFRAISASIWSLLGFSIGALLMAFFLSFLLNQAQNLGPATWSFAAVVFFAAYCLASYSASSIGKTRACEQMVRADNTLPSAIIDVDATKMDEAFMSPGELLKGDYRVVLFQPDRVWLFKPVEKDVNYVSVLMIPKESIRAISIQESTK